MASEWCYDHRNLIQKQIQNILNSSLAFFEFFLDLVYPYIYAFHLFPYCLQMIHLQYYTMLFSHLSFRSLSTRFYITHADTYTHTSAICPVVQLHHWSDRRGGYFKNKAGVLSVRRKTIFINLILVFISQYSCSIFQNGWEKLTLRLYRIAKGSKIPMKSIRNQVLPVSEKHCAIFKGWWESLILDSNS